MVVLGPARAQVVDAAWARRVVGVAYDAVSPEQRRSLAAADPDSFFNVVGPPGGALDAAGLDAAAGSLARLLDNGRYGPPREGLFLYRLRSADHEQVAVVGDIPTEAVISGSVRPHERTRTAKEDELARHLVHLRMNSSPVALTYRPSPRIDAVVGQLVTGPPLVDFATADGVAQQVWPVPAAAGDDLVDAFASVGAAYIVDGHHRVAASVRVGDPAVLAALIPSDQLLLLPYHRVVAGPLPRTGAELVTALGAEPVTLPAESVPPPGDMLTPGRVLLRVEGRWWRFGLGGDRRRLDVSALEEDVLSPLLGIIDPRADPRLDVVPGHHHLTRLADLADERAGAGFALCPPTLAQLMAEADAGRTLPPKSTWFEPKLRSGVFVVRR